MTTLMEMAVLAINMMAFTVVSFGALSMFVRCVFAAVFPRSTQWRLRDGYVKFGRWLIAGLTFQLAADIIDSMLTPDWTEIGKLAATAAIRTFLNFFLERDLAQVAELRDAAQPMCKVE